MANRISVFCLMLIPILCIVFWGCARPKCVIPVAASKPTAPPVPDCENGQLTSYGSLLVIAPHPDDETLGFAGLIESYLEQGKPVSVIVTTDGDAYCGACRFWKTSSVTGTTCGANDLSNFATLEIDSFGEIRRGESTSAAAILGLPAPTFLGYPDTGIKAAWSNLTSGEPYKSLHRSDFSACADCNSCKGGYGEGPETSLTASTLLGTLRDRISSTAEGTLIATTHWLDGHGDHSSLGKFVITVNAGMVKPRSIAFAVIHANTPKDTAFPDCWYPPPQALVCPCEDGVCPTQDPKWISELRNSRFHPDWPGTLPDDTNYGEAVQLCLPEKLYQGDSAIKTRAILEYKSQLGFLTRNGSHPESLAGIIDCNGYLISFVRRTEAFVLLKP